MKKIRKYIYDFFMELCCIIVVKEQSEYYDYKKGLNPRTTDINGVRTNHDLIAKINCRKWQDSNINITNKEEISIVKIKALKKERSRLESTNSTIKLKEFDAVMEILNLKL